MRDLFVLVVIGVGTYAMRAVFLVTAGSRPPRLLARALPHVGPAVLAAIILPALLAPGGRVSVGETLPAVLAAATAALLWRRWASVPIGLFGGLAVWWLVGWGLSRGLAVS